MRSLFPGYFRPTATEFTSLWASCRFSVDANVLLNLYRYSQATRAELEKALGGIRERLFLPNQAAKEFLKNRVGVTLGQAEEYTKTTKLIRDLKETLSNSKRHPFLPDTELPKFSGIADEICKQLDAQKDALIARLSEDEILSFVERTFDGRIGSPLDDKVMSSLTKEGEDRYNRAVPPGYRDGKKDESGDPYRKYGDLILWKQLIHFAREKSCDLIFITDDKKDDWWLEQSGRTIGPRPELIEEFARETGQKLWMYSVDKFVEEAAKTSNTTVSEAIIAEIIETREESRAEIEPSPVPSPPSEGREKRIHPVLTEDEVLNELRTFLLSHSSEDGSVGLRYFVVSYLGSQDFEINHSYAHLNSLAEKGIVEIFGRERNGVKTMCVKLCQKQQQPK